MVIGRSECSTEQWPHVHSTYATHPHRPHDHHRLLEQASVTTHITHLPCIHGMAGQSEEMDDVAQEAAVQPESARQSEEMHRVAHDAAVAQIAHLAKTWPIKRAWLPLTSRVTSAASTVPASSRSSPLLTLVSYNMLAQHLIRREMFSYCSKQSLRLAHRRQQLTAELLSYSADILALQEVDVDLYHQHYESVLASYGYDGRFGTADDKGHGCALFYKRDVFDVVDYELVQYADIASEYEDESTQREMNKANVAQIVALKLKQQPDASPTSPSAPSMGVIVTNHHLFWHPSYRFVRLRQCERLLSRTHAIAQQHRLPALLAGDWNITPSTHIYKWLVSRRLEQQYWYKYVTPVENEKEKGEDTVGSKPEDERWDESEEKSVLALQQQHERYDDMQRLLDRSRSLPLLASVYSSYTSLVPPLPPQPYCDWTGEAPFTNYTGGWKGTLDYCFVMRDGTAGQQQKQRSTDGVGVEVDSVLELPGLDVVASATALPNDTLGSDHLAIGCQFRLVQHQ